MVNPFSVVYGWWLFWLVVSSFGFGGMDLPSANFYYFPSILFVSASVGTFFAKLVSAKQDKSEKFVKFNALLTKRIYKITVILGILIIPFLYKSIGLLNGYGDDLASYRNDSLGSASEKSLIFGSVLSYVFYGSIFTPLLYFCAIYGVLDFIIYRRWIVLLSSSVLMFFDGVITFGRFAFYQILVIFILSKWLCKLPNKRLSLPNLKNSADLANKSGKWLMLGVLGFGLLITLLRLGDGQSLLAVVHHFVNYHTVGFVLFDKELQNNSSQLNSLITYGRASFGGIDEYLVLLTRQAFFPGLEPVKHVIGTYLNKFTLVGATSDGLPLIYNAYYTAIYTLYLDAGFFGVALGGAIFGFSVFVCARSWSKNMNLFSLFRLLLLLYLGFFSIFNSPLEGHRFWIPFLMTYVFQKFMRKNFRLGIYK
ncbi:MULTISPECIES: oligosaccharide repeat unit polymerase [unclassified Acidovorax]|uniref:oligosaccharide repeat unit polymerase n=1 Tax=unclassified Acidovorax TaxID=2684926 RepID=UPI001178A020|nr:MULTISPECIES: oligosaccharide repeat unit polymerase [unclassified Acidovorax]